MQHSYQNSIRRLADEDVSLCLEHFNRHWAESGRDGDLHFMPFAPSNADGPKGLDSHALRLGLDQVGWQRWWILIVDGSRVVGHANLKGDSLKTGLHRCELGIGLERPYRAQGHGRSLMCAAIDYAGGCPIQDLNSAPISKGRRKCSRSIVLRAGSGKAI